MSAWMSPHRFSGDVVQLRLGEQRHDDREQDPEDGLQELHGGAI